MEQNCQVCGMESDILQLATVNNGGLIEHKMCCNKCYGMLIISETNKGKENLICG